MSKQISPDQDIYVAPGMLGKFVGSRAIVIDQMNANIELDPTDLDHKILIYEREVKSWFLRPAKKLLEQDSFTNSLIVLMICMAYLEGVEQYKCGNNSQGRSKEYFVNSIERVFPSEYSIQERENLYKKTRCGLFHTGMVASGVLFNNGDDYPALQFGSDNTITVNPTRLLRNIEEDFEQYISELKSRAIGDTKRSSFNRLFSVL